MELLSAFNDDEKEKIESYISHIIDTDY